MLFLVNDILDYSQIKAGTFKTNISKFSISDVVKEALEIISFQANQKGL